MKPIYYAITLVLFSGVSLAKGKGKKKTSVTGYIHVLWEYDLNEDAVPDDEFRIERARIKFRNRISDNLSATIQIGCAQTPLTIKDVYFEYKVGQPLSFVVGQYKMPFSREELRPTSKLLVVDRGELNDIFNEHGYLGRDVGISIQGQVLRNMFPVEYALGVFNGSGCGFPGDSDNTKQFTQRMTVDPVNGLSVGINSTQKTDSATNEMVMAHGCNLLFQKAGAIIESEILLGDTQPGKTMIGGYLAGTYRIGCFEPAVKIERLYLDSRETEDYTASFTYGLNWYFHRKARLQANCITSILPEQETHHVVIIQAQVGF